ncbi:hypothetical protein [Agrilutibacter solisilvae]|uniref:Inhibitor I9 domain-containing protein n=1 Tax=Agrilutibacter solisilvae TaxID=2763317 RepID=A0A974Y3G2_9GAMM|nr:hypothetical protein [Lysobacter solisilvae]QSX77101.1 hypothetical protein I8J32_009805 [Lysobacter solisilvae]
MKFRLLALLALAAPLTAAGLAAPLHAAPQGQSARLTANDPMSPMYIVTSRENFEASLKRFGTQPQGLRDGAGREVVLSSVRKHQLDDMGHALHDRDGRCGGYFAFETRAKALAFLERATVPRRPCAAKRCPATPSTTHARCSRGWARWTKPASWRR